MNKIGIRAHDVGKMSASALASRIKNLGFDGIQLVTNKALTDVVDPDHLSPIAEAFQTLPILMLGAYFNPVHPDSSIVSDGIANFKKQLRIASKLSVPYVGTETGSLMGSPWGYVPENHDLKTFQEIVRIFKELVSEAERLHETVAVEGAWAHVVYSPRKLRELLDLVNSPNLMVTVDLFNYLNIENHENRMQLFEECLSLFGGHIVIYHLKDYQIQNNQLVQVGLGQGLMDYRAIIRRIQAVTPNAFLIFEGVTGEDIETSLTYIRHLMKGETKQ